MKHTFPCLMLEKKNTIQSDIDKVLNAFSIIKDQEHLDQQKKYYVEPVLSTDPGTFEKGKKD